MGRKALSVKDLTTSPSLTTLQSEGSRTKHVSFLDTPEVKNQMFTNFGLFTFQCMTSFYNFSQRNIQR